MLLKGTGGKIIMSKIYLHKKIEAINKYTGDDYYNINRYFEGVREAAPGNQKTINNVKSALDKASLLKI